MWSSTSNFEPDLVLRDLRERLRRISLHWPCYPDALRVTLIFASTRKGDPTSGIKPSQKVTRVTRGTRLFFVPFSRILLKSHSHTLQGRMPPLIGTLRTLSRTDRAFINVPVAEARDFFHCFSHVSDNFGEQSIPSDHVAVRIVLQKPTNRCDHVKRIPSWMSKHLVFCTDLKRISDGPPVLRRSVCRPG